MAALKRSVTAGSPPESCGMVTDLPGCDPGVVIDVIAYPCVSAAGGAVEVARVVVVVLVLVLAVVAVGPEWPVYN